MSLRLRAIGWTLTLHVALTSSPVQAADGDDVPTVAINVDYGPTTYKSELVDSNDTSFSMRYSIGIYAGETKSVVFMLKSDANTTTFKLNTSEVISNWQDTQLQYRWTYFYIGAVIATVNMTANAAGTDLFELTGTGYGGAFGTALEFGRGGKFYLDVASVSISKISEVNQAAVTFGARTDIDIGASYGLSRRMFDLLFGYRQRTLPITLGTASAETISTTYLGLATALDF